MKHRNLTMLTLVTLTAFVLVGCSLAYADDSVPAGSPSTSPTQISQEDALQIALEHAGVAAEDISHQNIRWDTDDAVPEYEIEFHTAAAEFDYDIHAHTGQVLSWDAETRDIPPLQEPAVTAPAGLISQTEAEDIALTHAGVTRDQVVRLQTELDWDDGVPKYEIEFHMGSTEFDHEIHAETGDILSWEKEIDD